MREVVLASLEDAPRRVESVKRSFEIIYGVELEVDLEEVALDRVFPTEEFLENDKLALVFMKVVTEDYGVPIITVKRDGDYFVVDGHHRAFIFRKLRKKTAKAYVLKFPDDKKFRVVPKRSLETLPIKDVSDIDDPILKAWQRTLGVLKLYEAIYNVPFYLEQEQVRLKDLVPTQPQVGRNQIDAIKEPVVPIVCVKYKGKYYVLDGHARALRAKQLLFDSIKAIVLAPAVRIDFGIVKTAEETNLRSLEDIKILD